MVSRNFVMIVSSYYLSPEQRQAITWSNDDLYSVRPQGTNFQENQMFDSRKSIINIINEKATVLLFRPEFVNITIGRCYVPNIFDHLMAVRLIR